MNRTSLRTIFIAFLGTLIILNTLAGLTITAFNTRSAMAPMDTPASARIAENGSCYEFSFFDQLFTFPRFPIKETETFLNQYSVLIPKTIIFLNYGYDRLSNFFK